MEVPAGIFRPRYQSKALLVPAAQAERQKVEYPTEYINRLRWKNLLQPEGDRTSLQQAIHRLLCPTRSGYQKAPEKPPPPPPSGSLIQAVRREGHRSGHCEGGLLHSQGPDGLTMLHLRHLGPHGLAFLTELFNLSVAGINIPAIWNNSVLIPILKAGKPRE